MNETLNIAIVEDDATFMKILYGRLDRHLFQLERYWDRRFELNAYPSAQTALKSISTKPDLLFIDYHLEEGLTADDVLFQLRMDDRVEDAVVISEDRRELAGLAYHSKHIRSILRKDTSIIPRCCLLVEELLLQKVHGQ